MHDAGVGSAPEDWAVGDEAAVDGDGDGHGEVGREVTQQPSVL